MTEETSIITKETTGPTQADSSIGGVSVRAWLAVFLVFTVCFNHLSVTVGVLIDAISKGDWAKVGTFSTVGEPLYSMAVAALGFYFGNSMKSKP